MLTSIILLLCTVHCVQSWSVYLFFRLRYIVKTRTTTTEPLSIAFYLNRRRSAHNLTPPPNPGYFLPVNLAVEKKRRKKTLPTGIKSWITYGLPNILILIPLFVLITLSLASNVKPGDRCYYSTTSCVIYSHAYTVIVNNVSIVDT